MGREEEREILTGSAERSGRGKRTRKDLRSDSSTTDRRCLAQWAEGCDSLRSEQAKSESEVSALQLDRTI